MVNTFILYLYRRIKLNTQEKIRFIREINQWSQEEMAEKMKMSLNGYAKIERGETKLNLEKLNQIAQIFNMDAADFMTKSNQGFPFLLNDNIDCPTQTNYYNSNEELAHQNEKLILELKLKDELLQQKNNEIQSLKEIINLLKNQISES